MAATPGRFGTALLVLFLVSFTVIAQGPPITAATLFSNTDTPAVLNANGGAPLELGMKFFSDHDGYIFGVRFYKGTSNVGTHVGSLWTTTGQLLAQATFGNETASGWQLVMFANPVPITANTVYVVSYHSSAFYSYTTSYFLSQVDNAPLHAPSKVSTSNGVFDYGATGTFPTTGAAGANLWVDAVFSTTLVSLVSVAVTPANPSIGAGGTLQFQATGTYSDNSTLDLTSQVTWSSGTQTVATINAGLATALTVGTSLITATVNGISGSTTLTVTTAPPPPPPPTGPSYTLFSSSATPTVADANAGGPLELGMKFTADQNGFASGVRFYKGASNLGTHIGSLWTAAGQLLAQVTFTGETASGWQQANFSPPLAITANTVYVISYHSTAGFSYTLNYFNSPVDNPPLHAVVRDNGVYSFGAASVFPVGTAGSANFWVDVVFTTNATAAPLISIAVTPANPSVSSGSTQQFQAVGTYSDSTTQDITGQVTWTSADSTVAIINSAGLATANNAGSSLITATQGSISGNTTLSVTGTPPPPPSANTYTLFSNTAVPDVADANAGQPLELGLKFTADRNGSVTGVRFYKGPSNTGTHVGSLWTVDGQLLAQTTFSSETAAGLQEMDFPTPVPIVANAIYVISYHSTGHFSYTLGYFNHPVDNPPLHAVAGSNGLFSFGPAGTLPVATAGATNFWVDVVFTTP
jgi:hypothetical protein